MFKIRIARIQDAKWIHKILNENSEFKNQEIEEEYSMAWVNGAIKNKKGNVVLIMENDKEVIGLLVIHIILGTRDVIFNNLYIKPEFRRNNFGTKLLREGEKIAKKIGCKYFFGAVKLRNIKPQRLLSKLGYKRGNTFISYWRKV